MDDGVGCVSDVQRRPHVEARAVESEERADRDFQEGGEEEKSEIQGTLPKYVHCRTETWS